MWVGPRLPREPSATSNSWDTQKAAGFSRGPSPAEPPPGQRWNQPLNRLQIRPLTWKRIFESCFSWSSLLLLLEETHLDVVILGACDHQVLAAACRLIHSQTHHRTQVADELSGGRKPDRKEKKNPTLRFHRRRNKQIKMRDACRDACLFHLIIGQRRENELHRWSR